MTPRTAERLTCPECHTDRAGVWVKGSREPTLRVGHHLAPAGTRLYPTQPCAGVGREFPA